MQHTIQNRTIFCHDNLEILQGINSRSIDLLYLDPPFNKKKVFTAPIGSSASGAEFSDIFREEDVKEEWLQTIKEDQEKLHAFLDSVKIIEGRTSYNFCYLAYMSIRLIEMSRVLKDRGSIYLHCDPTMSHYLKLVMDCIFGEKNFRNEISWKRTARGFKGSQYSPRSYNNNVDSILFYSRSDKSYFDMKKVLEEYSADYIQKTFRLKDSKGIYYLDNAFNRMSAPIRPNLCYTYKGIDPPHASGWMIGIERMKELDALGELVLTNNTIKRKIRPSKGKIRNSLWDDISSLSKIERRNYPTQKPIKLLERIIKASSNEGDLVLDPFCGCATTCVAAEKLNRKWIGIDVSYRAYELVKKRLNSEIADPENLFDWDTIIVDTTVPPKRTDIGADTRPQKWVYVISNPQFVSGMYKVGITADVEKRLDSYQTGDTNRGYKVEYTKRTQHFRDIEKYIHETFESRHEWVRAKLFDIVGAIENYSPQNGHSSEHSNQNSQENLLVAED